MQIFIEELLSGETCEEVRIRMGQAINWVKMWF